MDTGMVAWDGAGLKFAVTMTCQGFSMDDDNWTITVSRGSRSVVFTKESSVRDNEGQWYICLDTSELGGGRCYITFEADVPDEDFPTGFRKEIQRFELINIKSY